MIETVIEEFQELSTLAKAGTTFAIAAVPYTVLGGIQYYLCRRATRQQNNQKLWYEKRESA